MKLSPRPCDVCPRYTASCRCHAWKKWFSENWRAVQAEFDKIERAPGAKRKQAPLQKTQTIISREGDK